MEVFLMDTIFPITKAKSILLDLIRRAKEEGEVFTLTKRGEPEGVISTPLPSITNNSAIPKEKTHIYI